MEKGFKHSLATKEKIRLAHLGIKRPGIGGRKKGSKNTEEWNKKISLNSPKYWLGVKRDEKFCKNLSDRSKGKHYSPNTEFKKKKTNCHKLAGGKVRYRTLHTWVTKNLGRPETCEFCGKTGLKGHQIHWASKTNDYKKDLKDWIRLCVKCHFKKDRL